MRMRPFFLWRPPLPDIRQITAAETLELRRTVLRPGGPLSAVQIDGDAEALHFGAFDAGILIATASLFTTGADCRLRKFAVLPAYQGQGLGTKMLATMIPLLAAQGVTRLWCDARIEAVGVYSRAGFTAFAPRFTKNDRLYQKMQKHL